MQVQDPSGRMWTVSLALDPSSARADRAEAITLQDVVKRLRPVRPVRPVL
jgi:hypothetical protein